MCYMSSVQARLVVVKWKVSGSYLLSLLLTPKFMCCLHQGYWVKIIYPSNVSHKKECIVVFLACIALPLISFIQDILKCSVWSNKSFARYRHIHNSIKKPSRRVLRKYLMFAKRSILDVFQGSEHPFIYLCI